jgi:hypothetical protein
MRHNNYAQNTTRSSQIFASSPRTRPSFIPVLWTTALNTDLNTLTWSANSRNIEPSFVLDAF